MNTKTTKELLQALSKGDLTSEALTRACLSEIEAKDEQIGAFLSVDADAALEAAATTDRKRKAGEPLGPLAGIPVAIKDNINVQNRNTTCGSRFLADFVSPYDATVVSRLRAADAVLIGKTNMDEFAMGSSTEYSALGTTRNPVDPSRVPGGSSGGSAAAVAAGMVPLALGSSTGGSIRQPAAFCGVVGMKPTYGQVSRYGLVAYGSSLDQIGPLACDVDGTARLLEVIAGHDANDATSVKKEVPPLLEQLDLPLKGLRAGLIREFLSDELNPQIRLAVEQTVALLKENGAEIIECSLPHTEYSVPAYYMIATAEASSNLARYDGVRYSRRSPDARNLKEMYVKSRSEGFGLEVKRRILLGTYCLSSGYYEGYYLNAQKVRTCIINDFAKAYQDVDVLIAPTTPTTAFRFGEKTTDPVAMYLGDIYTVMANLAGIPAISLPAGTDDEGLPIGVQLMGNHFREDVLLRAARMVEKAVAT